MKWEKTGHEVKANGESTVTYTSKDEHFQIESRKRAIPHAGGREGYWMHTTYFLIDRNSGAEKEYYSLKDAKAAAEAAKIIHCKDCVHYNAGFECLIEGYGIERDKDWYCADAERRKE